MAALAAGEGGESGAVHAALRNEVGTKGNQRLRRII